MKRKTALFISIVMLLSLALGGCNNQSQNQSDRIMEAEYSYATPDYQFQLYLSDDVILGEVVEELDTFYSNPNGEIKELANAQITPYVIKIEKSYKGLLAEGETVIVSAWNKVGLSPEDAENAAFITDEKSFYLHKGQRGVFMLDDCSEYLATDEMKEIYEVVYQNEGVFEEKISGNASMGEELKTTYVSPSFEITLDQIPTDIQKADQHYKN